MAQSAHPDNFYSGNLALDVVPMRLPEASMAYGSALAASADYAGADDVGAGKPAGASLLLHPGEPTALRLRLRNDSDRPLRFSFHFSSSAPETWLISDLQPHELTPTQRREAELVFQAPADFFETLTDALPGERRPLNYSGQLEVHSHTLDGELTGVTTEAVSLMVRPNSLYTALLPQVYQEIDMVGRLMALVERTFRPDVETWNTLWAHFDPLIAPQAMLGFLAHWVGWRSLPQLSWTQQRRLIHRATELYTWRGTTYGLRLFLHLATGLPLDDGATPEGQKHISIVEPSQQGAVFGESVLDGTTVFGGGQGFHFSVVLRCPTDLELDEGLVRTIIDRQRPAFCTYDLSIQRDFSQA